MLQTRKLSKLIKDLSCSDASKRRSAAENLSDADERAVYPLIKALRDENPGVQDAAMRSLIKVGSESVAYMVLPLLREDSYLRNTALVILRDIGLAVVPLLYSLLKDRDDDIRKFGIDLMTDIKEGVDPGEIVPLIRDTNANVRASAVKALGVLGYREAVPAIAAALKDEEWVCFSALEAFAQLRDEASVVPIAELLSSSSETIRYAAIETLGVIGSKNAAEFLTAHLSKTEGSEKEAAIKSLLMTGVTPSVPGIEDILIDMFKRAEWNEKLVLLKGIADLKETKALASVIDIAGSLDSSVPEDEEMLFGVKSILKEFGCTEALVEILGSPLLKYRGLALAIGIIGELKCRNAVPHLINLLKRDLRDVRRESILALGEIDDNDARQALVGAIADKDSHVRKAAVAALGRTKDKEAFSPILSMLRTEKYQDVTEEAVKALLKIDQKELLSRINELSGQAAEAVGQYRKDLP